MSEITRGFIGKEDYKLWDGTTTTFNRRTVTGGTESLTRIDWDGVDVLHVFGSGSNYNDSTIRSAITKIGSTNKVKLRLSRGTWTISNDLVINSNITLSFDPGAVIADDINNANLTIYGDIIAGKNQTIFNWDNGSGTISLAGITEAYVRWFAGNYDGTTSDLETFQTAVNSLSAGSTLIFPYNSTPYCTSDYLLPKTGVNIRGENRVGWYMAELAANTPIIYFSSNSNITVSGFKFYSDYKDSHIYGISYAGTNNKITIEDCYFYGLKIAITVGGGSIYRIRGCDFESVGWTTDGDGAGGAVLLYGEEVVVSDCRFKDIGMTYKFHCVYATTGSYGVNVSDCYAEDVYGFMIASGTTDIVNVNNCTVKDCYGGFTGRLNCSNVAVIDKNDDKNDTGGSAFYLFDNSTLTNFQVHGCEGGSFLYIGENVKVSNGVCQATSTYWNSNGISMLTEGWGTVVDNVTFKGTGVVAYTYNGHFCTFGTKYGWTIRNCRFDSVCKGASNGVIYISDNYCTIENNMFYTDNADYFNMIDIRYIGNNGYNKIVGNTFRHLNGTPTIEIYFDVLGTQGVSVKFDNNHSQSTETNFPTVASGTTINVNSNTYSAHINFNANIEAMNGTVLGYGNIVTLYFSVISTIKHVTGAGYYFINKSGADIVTAAGDVYQFMFQGTYWRQI